MIDDGVASLEQAAEARWLAAWLAGPKRTRWETLPPQLGDAAPDLALPDTDGRMRQLSEFWRERPALVLLLRHFGCSCLTERWERLEDELPAYEAAGATVVAIVQGEPERTRAVAQRRGYPFPILCDPQRTAYARYGVLEGSPAQILHDFPWTSTAPSTARTSQRRRCFWAPSRPDEAVHRPRDGADRRILP